ncbi:MAG: DUF3604 domain-containing protein, partial [Cellvibrionaceae bacterium]|nr:DUF3604 domain-containing protein [Cellvibrionaceae bacterium]
TSKVKGWDFSASGLAAVWAEENTRESIFEAFKRKEVYATSGSRIGLRVFGGWNFKQRDAKAKQLAQRGYKKGVAMGGDLAAAPKGKAPSFLIQAVRDPDGAKLDRVQMVKGYLDAEGKPREQVYNLAVSGERKLDKKGNTRPVANTVDLKRGTYTNNVGADEFSLVWKDPDFDPSQRAFYYVRVLEIPTPRYSLLDALALNKAHPEQHPPTIQERAYSSAIWYTP